MPGANNSKTQTVTTQQANKEPWGPAVPLLQGILGGVDQQSYNYQANPTEQAALTQISANAANAPNWAPQATDLTKSFLTGDPSGLLGQSLANQGQTADWYGNQFANLKNVAAPAAEAGLRSGLADYSKSLAGNLAPYEQGLDAYKKSLASAITPYEQGLTDYKTAATKQNAALDPIVSADLDPTKTPGIQNLLATINSDVSKSVNEQYAGAGRDLSGLNQQSLARGISQGYAAPLLAQYNANVANRMGAAGQQFGAAGNIFSGQGNLYNARSNAAGNIFGAEGNLYNARNAAAGNKFAANAGTENQIFNNAGNVFNAAGQTAGVRNTLDQFRAGVGNQMASNKLQGLGLTSTIQDLMNSGPMGVLAAQAMARGLPLENLGMLANLTLPIAGLGGQVNQTGTQKTNSNPGILDNFLTFTKGVSNLIPKTPISFG